jgi:ketosteroid isomerase-like protein
MTRTLSVAGVLVALMVGQPDVLHGQDSVSPEQEAWSSAQQEVWERERAYYQYLEQRDVDKFMSLWNERFVGWPQGSETPIDYSDLRQFVGDWFSELPEDRRYTLEPLAVNVYSDIGITYYRTVTYDAGEKVSVARLHHVWRKRDGEWQIIGGMSAPAETAGNE